MTGLFGWSAGAGRATGVEGLTTVSWGGVVDFLRALGIPLGGVLVGVTLGILVYVAGRFLAKRPETDRSGTLPASVVPSGTGRRPENLPPGLPLPQPRTVRVHSAEGDRDLTMIGVGDYPSITPPRARRFIAVLVASFAAFAFLLVYFFRPIFGRYDHLVALVGSFLYWPTRWPGVYAVSVQTLVVPDYIFPMYLAGMGAFLVASGLIVNRPRYTLRRRGLALLVVVTYVGVELVLDALFFTVPGSTLRDFALLVRATTGGLFLTLLTFCLFHLPEPQRIVPRFPRQRAAITAFFAAAVGAFLISATVLLAISSILRLRGIFLGFTLLLLVPILTLVLFGAFGRALYFRRMRRRPLPALADYHPAVSIIIPAYNEQEWIEEAVRAADRASAGYPGHVEIIVGNDGSTDQTSELARKAVLRLEHAVGFVIDLPHGGKSSALNGALAVATGEIVLRCDGDTFISEDPGFAAMIRHFADPEVGAVQGAIHPRQRKGWTRKLRALEIAWNHYLLRPAGMATNSAEVVDGLFSAFRRKDIVELGGYVPWNGEDTELSIRVQRLGYRTRIEFGALAYEDVPEDYEALRRQRVRWARGILMANGQHFPALLGPTPEFAGLGVFFWFLLNVRSGVRSLVYLYLALLIVILGIPALIFTAVLLAIAVVVRAVPLGYFLVRIRRPDVLPWIPFFTIGNIVKQTFRFEAFGTLGPGVTQEYV